MFQIYPELVCFKESAWAARTVRALAAVVVVSPWAVVAVAAALPLQRKRRSCGKGRVLECGSAQSDVLLVKECCQCFFGIKPYAEKIYTAAGN